MYPSSINEHPDDAACCAHHLLPGCLIPNHKFLSPKYPNRSLDPQDYLDKIKDEIRMNNNTNLIVISSEVFSETQSIQLITKIGQSLGGELQIFVSNRQEEQQALSAIKHFIRNSDIDFNIFKRYRQVIRNVKSNLNYWKQSDLNYVEKFLEARPNNQNLVEYYFGDIFEPYGQEVRKILSQQKNIENEDPLDQCVYLMAFLWNNNTNINKFKDVVSENKDMQNIVSKDHLLNYLNFFIKPLDDTSFLSEIDDHALTKYDIEITKEKQEEALISIGLEQQMIEKILNIIHNLL